MVTTTFQRGYQIAPMMAIRGQNSIAKAERTAQALFDRARRMMRESGFEDYTATLVELLGAESMYGPHRRVCESREIVLRIAAQHPQRKALEFLQKKSASAGTSMGPGTCSHFGGRSGVQSVIGTASYYIVKSHVPVHVQASPLTEPIQVATHDAPMSPQARPLAGDRSETRDAEVVLSSDMAKVPLSRLAHGCSGDKGNDVNIGIVARWPRWWPVLCRELTTERVKDCFSHLVDGEVTRYELPGIAALMGVRVACVLSRWANAMGRCCWTSRYPARVSCCGLRQTPLLQAEG